MIRSIRNDGQESSPSIVDVMFRSAAPALFIGVLVKAYHPLTGFMYGGLAGGIHYSVTKLGQYTNIGQSQTNATKPYFQQFTDIFSWSTSALVLAKTAHALHRPLFFVNAPLAISTALVTEILMNQMNKNN